MLHIYFDPLSSMLALASIPTSALLDFCVLMDNIRLAAVLFVFLFSWTL